MAGGSSNEPCPSNEQHCVSCQSTNLSAGFSQSSSAIRVPPADHCPRTRHRTTGDLALLLDAVQHLNIDSDQTPSRRRSRTNRSADFAASGRAVDRRSRSVHQPHVSSAGIIDLSFNAAQRRQIARENRILLNKLLAQYERPLPGRSAGERCCVCRRSGNTSRRPSANSQRRQRELDSSNRLMFEKIQHARPSAVVSRAFAASQHRSSQLH